MIPVDQKKIGIFVGLFAVCCYIVSNFYLRIFASLWCLFFYYLFAELPKRPRSMSFTSGSMAKGAFPPSCNPLDPIIHLLIYFKTLPDVENLKKTIVDEMMKYDRFNSVPLHFPDGTSVWSKVDNVDVDEHITQHTVQSEEEALQKVEGLFSESLKEGSPLWQFHIFNNTGNGLSMMCLRIHHSIGDGIALYQVFSNFFRDVNGEPLPPLPMFARKNRVVKFSLGLVGKILTAVGQLLTLAGSKFDSPILFTDPNKEKGATGGKRKILTFPHQSLQRIKDIKDKAKVTVNDVMMSVTAGAIRRYCIDRKDPAFISGEKLQMRALLPIAFPRKPAADPYKGDTGSLRNLFTFLSTGMAINEKDPIARIKATAKETDALKKSPFAMVSLKFNSFLGPKLPFFLARQTLLDTFSRHSVVFSNVPGPTQPILFGNALVDHFQMVFPNQITQAGILSYNGRVAMCLTLDESYITNPQKVADYFVEELEELEKELGITK